MEYKRYKSVLEEMRLMEEGRSLQFDRGNVERELKSLANIALVDIELEQLTLYSLMKTFQRVLDKMEDRKKKIVHQVYNFSHSIQGQQIFILKNLKKGEQTSFESLFGGCKNRMHAIITFLALLELLNLQTIKVINGIGMNNFWLTPFDEEEYNKLPDANNDDEEE
jgi:segregation and condensation protein A